MSIYDQRNKESEVAHFFINQYKENIIIKPDTEDEEGDFILTFPDRKVKVQIVSCDHEAIPVIIKAQKHEGDVFNIDRNPVNSIISKIKQKSEHYDQTLLKEMFLLIHSENILINHDFLIKGVKEACDNSNYKSIYFIKLPDNNQKETFPKNKGDLIQLK